MTTRLYTAGSSAEIPRVRDFAARAQALGYSLSHRWWEHVEHVRGLGLSDADLPRPDQFAHASGDLRAVSRADVMVLLVPREKSEGSMGEFLYAYALSKLEGRERTLIACGPDAGRSIFHSVAHVVLPSDAAALEWLHNRISVHLPRGRDGVVA